MFPRIGQLFSQSKRISSPRLELRWMQFSDVCVMCQSIRSGFEKGVPHSSRIYSTKVIGKPLRQSFSDGFSVTNIGRGRSLYKSFRTSALDAAKSNIKPALNEKAFIYVRHGKKPKREKIQTLINKLNETDPIHEQTQTRLQATSRLPGSNLTSSVDTRHQSDRRQTGKNSDNSVKGGVQETKDSSVNRLDKRHSFDKKRPVLVTEVEPSFNQWDDTYFNSGAESKDDMQHVSSPQKFKDRPLVYQHYFNINLKSFAEVSIFVGEGANVFNYIQFYRTKRKSLQKKGNPQQVSYQITDVGIYESLLSYLAKQMHLKDMHEVFGMMREDGMTPSMKCYAAALECIGRGKTVNLVETETFLKQMSEQGLCLEDIFIKTSVKKDEIVFVRKALETAKPGFKANFMPDPEPYSGELVEPLNECLSPEQKAEVNPYGDILSKTTLQQKLKVQLKNEMDMFVEMTSVYKDTSSGPSKKIKKEALKKWKEDWKVKMLLGFQHRKAKELKRNVRYDLLISPFLSLFTDQEFVDIMMKEAEKLAQFSNSYSPTVTNLQAQLGETLWHMYKQKVFLKEETVEKIMKIYKHYAAVTMDPNKNFSSFRSVWQTSHKHLFPDCTLEDSVAKWSTPLKLALGRFLYNIILEEVKVDANYFNRNSEPYKVQAFYPLHREGSMLLTQEIKPHPILLRVMAFSKNIKFPANDLPMLVPPIPWITPTFGGNFMNSYKILRLLNDKSQAQMEMFKAAKHTEPTLDALTNLGSCAWTINKPMLDLMIQVFNDTGNPDLDIPSPASQQPDPPKITNDMTKEEKSKAVKEKYALDKQAAEMNSRWFTELYRFSIANKFRNEVFWFPHSMDFRGRTYPIPPHMNHLGGDIARGMLKFAKGKPLGEEGLNWLKIHLVNLTAMKKRASNKERIAFAEEMMPEIQDSADLPLTGRKWWMSSEEPWQTLAMCKEVMGATRSPDHTQFVCSIPVHQDGSCNGLQHYAALGRDLAGAMSVNLCPSDEPQDVYSEVVDLVEIERQKDEAQGMNIAKILKGYVVRKTIKQTIMTTVYGVTKYGAKLQILRQLKDLPDFPEHMLTEASNYLTDKTFYCLTQMFTSAKEIQDWFTQTATLISGGRGRPVMWITPLNLPVIQPYHKWDLNVSSFGVMTISDNKFLRPDTMKQKNAFPPNYIHSVDSVHMMLTSLYCLRAGITFVSVHDCFWTHACDVPIMNQITRQQFVSLHNQPILEDLSKFLVETYCPEMAGLNILPDQRVVGKRTLYQMLTRIPKRGTFDLANVLKSTYFFS